MKVSLKTIEPYVTIPVGTDELVDTINKQLGGVDEVIDYSEKYKDVIIVSIVECEPHPNADKLSVCMVDDAGVVPDVERDERGLVRVVCGAPNVSVGMLTAWLPPKAIVPSTFGTKDEFVLDARELRGIKSNGMLAASDELAIGSDHDGIVVLDPKEWNPQNKAPAPGAMFADVYGLNDTVIDIENKMFTHRPDCFGQIGVARELAGIFDVEFRQPEWLTNLPDIAAGEGLDLHVENQSPELVPRFMAIGIQNVTIEKSSMWMQCELMRLGSKSINNVVDMTNYIMLMTGQPTHAYDYDTLKGGTLVARNAVEGESITLLNGRTYALDVDDVVIADAERAIGIAGIMGGLETEVTSATTNLVLEVATFDMYAVRKSSMRHGIFTDAVTRFNKGQSPHQNPYIIRRLLRLITESASGSTATALFDESHTLSDTAPIAVTAEFINVRLGSTLTLDEIKEVLGRVGFVVDTEHDTASVHAPYWRTDISLPEDIVEEIGRLRGFGNLPKQLPMRVMSPAPKNVSREFKQRVRSSLRNMGGNELLTYSFVHEKTMVRAGQESNDAFRLSNALSPDLHFYRLSILPSLIEKAVLNARAGYDEMLLFELGKTHNKTIQLNDESLPQEPILTEGIYMSKQDRDGAAFYVARRAVAQLMNDLNIDVEFRNSEEVVSHSFIAPYDPNRSAAVYTKAGVYLGVVGELRQAVRKSFKLHYYAAAFSLQNEPLQTAAIEASKTSQYIKLSRYPKVSQDISLRASSEIPFLDLFAAVSAACSSHEISVEITPGVIYQAPEDTSVKTTTFHLKLVSQNKTLTDEDAKTIIDKIVSNAQQAVGAELV